MSQALLIDLNRQLADLFAQREYASGFALGRHILQSYPRHLPTYKQMGLAALDAGLVADSVDLLQRALSADPEDGEMWAALHDAASRLEMHPDAEVAGAYAHDLLQQPEQEASPIALGHAAARKKEWVRAYEAYRRGFLAHPERMDAGLGLMTALFHLEQWRPSLEVAQLILEELPYSLKALWIAIRCSFELKDDSVPVQKYLRKAHELDPDNVYAHHWFDNLSELETSQPRAGIDAWDDSERWTFGESASPVEPDEST